MRYDSEHKARTREKLLKIASAAIRANGTRQLGIAAVMAGAGLTHGGFYAHFKSRDELISEAIDHMFDERYAAFLKRIDLDDPRAALLAFIDRYLSMEHRNEAARGCPIPALAADVPRLPAVARAHFLRGVGQIEAGLTRLLRDHGSDDAPTLAASAVAEMVGALGLARASEDGDAPRILEASRSQLKARLGLSAQPS